jgi:hypothetical protein
MMDIHHHRRLLFAGLLVPRVVRSRVRPAPPGRSVRHELHHLDDVHPHHPSATIPVSPRRWRKQKVTMFPWLTIGGSPPLGWRFREVPLIHEGARLTSNPGSSQFSAVLHHTGLRMHDHRSHHPSIVAIRSARGSTVKESRMRPVRHFVDLRLRVRAVLSVGCSRKELRKTKCRTCGNGRQPRPQYTDPWSSFWCYGG